jgi:hypothetical protein
MIEQVCVGFVILLSFYIARWFSIKKCLGCGVLFRFFGVLLFLCYVLPFFLLSNNVTNVTYRCSINLIYLYRAIDWHHHQHGHFPLPRYERDYGADWRSEINLSFSQKYPAVKENILPDHRLYCPSETTSHPSYVAVIGDSTVWTEHGKPVSLYSVPHPESTALLIEVNNNYYMPRNEHGDIFLKDILSDEYNENFFCVPHYKGVCWQSPIMRVLMCNGRVIYFYDPPTADLLHDLFVISDEKEDYATLPFALEPAGGKPIVLHIFLLTVWWFLLVFCCLRLSLTQQRKVET